MIKNLLIISVLLLCACKQKSKKETSAPPQVNDTIVSTASNDQSWTGTINKEIPVFLHYAVEDDLIYGEITYLNTGTKPPVRIIGTIDSDSTYRMLEFEPTGNITGIISGRPDSVNFSLGRWFSPETREDLTVNLIKKDTIIKSSNFQ